MRRYAKLLISALVLISLLLGGSTVQLLAQIRACAALTGDVILVRSTTQRVAKLELANQPDDSQISLVDGYLRTLSDKVRARPYSALPLHDAPEQMNTLWAEMKQAITQTRGGARPDEFLKTSETMYQTASELLNDVHQYSTQLSAQLTLLMLMIAAVTVFAWVGLLFFYLRRLRRLETDNRGLSNIAYLDKLTGAPNLDKFKLDAQDIIDRCRNQKFAVLYIDFENFQYLNDVFGRAYGDKVLREYANILRNGLGRLETFCRISADNFLVLRSYQNKESLLRQQKEIDAKLYDFSMSSKEKNFIWVCCGICCREDVQGPLPISDLIEGANFARKRAKGQPLHYVFYDESIRQKLWAEKNIENHMQSALEAGEFLVYLQPKVELVSNQIACAEALVRWQSSSAGVMIAPDEFIPIFEKNLFITFLDQYVLRQTCIWLRGRLDTGRPVVPISVNVSRMQLYDSNFLPAYTRIKNEFSIPNGLLEIEFTESVVFENMQLLHQIISDLKEVGFRCSLDDFGKGYSSLNLLKDLPVDVLKLDGLFFEEDENPDRARTVVEGIVTMAKNLNLTIVAEGVEREDQVAFLRGIGCHMVQGYVFYRPMPLAECGILLDRTLTD